MNHENRWLIVILASSVVAVLAAIASTGDALSMMEMLWFLAVIPGLPYVRMLWKDGDPVAFWITTIGLSIAIDALVAEALLYLGLFNAISTVSVLAVIACFGALLGRRRSAQRNAAPVGTKVKVRQRA